MITDYTHYSAFHWWSMERAIDKYIDDLNDKKQYIPFTDKKAFARNYEMRKSAGERLRYAHVNYFKMLGDPLRSNGISFGVALDDLKKDLHKQIDVRFENERIESERESRQDNQISWNKFI